MIELLRRTLTHAEHYPDGPHERPVAAPADPAWMRERFDGPLPAGPVDPRTVIDDLVDRDRAQARHFATVLGAEPRISVSGWNTTDDDVERAIHAIRHAAA